MIAYKITRSECSGWCHAGSTIEEVINTLKNELDMNEGLSVDELDQITLVPYETTQEEIDSLPEFQGW